MAASEEDYKRVIRSLGDRNADLQRELRVARNANFLMDAGVLKLAERLSYAPPTETEIAAWVDSQKFIDDTSPTDEPITLEGLHPWHRGIILQAVAHFTKQKEI